MVVTIATSATIACGDAAVDPVTAPEPAAQPATSAGIRWPYEWEVTPIPASALGLQIAANAYFENGYGTFVVSAQVSFQWSNQVSANIEAWLLNKSGQTVNSGKQGLSYSRLALPVPQGDTTLTVRISTNNVTCGLIGKGSYSGSAAMVAIDARLIQITLASQTIQTTTTPDVVQPACPPPPGCELEPVSRVSSGTTSLVASSVSNCLPPLFPPVDGSQEFEVCFAVWRELWLFDYISRTYSLQMTWVIGMICYISTVMS